MRRCAHDGIWCCCKVWRPFHHYTRPDFRWSVSCHIWYDRCCWTLQSAVRGHELVTKPVHRGFVAINGIGASILFGRISQCHSDRSVATYSKPLPPLMQAKNPPPPFPITFLMVRSSVLNSISVGVADYHKIGFIDDRNVMNSTLTNVSRSK